MRALLQLLIVLASVPRVISATAACYNALGQPVDGWVPCNPSLPVSACCSPSDLCLSDGACLNAGSDNGFTIQGCTDQQWGIPCLSNCLSSQSSSFQRLTPCDLVQAKPQFCCGQDRSCCDDSDKVFGLPPFSDATYPPTAAVTSGPRGSPTSASTGGSSASTDGSKETSPGSAEREKYVTIGVGVGVGVGVGLPLIGVIVWFAYQLRKRNKLAATGGVGGQMSYAGLPGQYEYPYGESPRPVAQQEYPYGESPRPVAQPSGDGVQEAPDGRGIQEMPAK